MLMINMIRAFVILFAFALYGLLTHDLITIREGFAVLFASFSGLVLDSIAVERVVEWFNRSKNPQELRF